MKNSLFICCLLASISLFAQQAEYGEKPKLTITIPEGPTPWTSLDLNNDPRNFQFAIVTDRTGGHRDGVFEDGVNKLNLLQPEFVMSVGDLIEGYTEDVDQLNREWEEFDGFVEKLDMPFFYTVGNHDITNAVMEEVWKKRLGPTYYSFLYKNVLFVVMNSEDQRRGAGRGTISDRQYEWIKKTLEINQGVRWTLLFMHQPLWDQNADPARWFDVEKLLADRKHTVYVGHRHNYVQYERNNSKYYILATMGGGSALRGPELGEFDHFAWITMTDNGPIMANLQLEGIWSADMVTQDVKDYIVKVQGQNAIQVEPLFVENEGFQEENVTIKITNDENVPMAVTFKEGFSWDLIGAVDKPELEVAPNSVETVQLNLRNRRGQTVKNLAPLKLTAEISYAFEDMPDLAIPITYSIQPEPKHKLTETSVKKVDGNLDDWKELTHSISTENTEDLSVQFDLGYDDNYLYIAANVQDDELKVEKGKSLHSQDMIGFALNAEPLMKSAMDKASGGYENSVLLLQTPKVKGQTSQIYPEDRSIEGLQKIVKAVEGGYVMEIGIPLSYVKERQGDNWKTVRFNLRVEDEDSAGHSDLQFQPEWGSGQNRAGSGMFFRVMDSEAESGSGK